MKSASREHRRHSARRLPTAPTRDIAVGRITTAHGVRGQVRVEPLTDDPGRFRRLAAVRLELPDGEQRRAQVESAVVSAGGRILLKLQGCDDRDAAHALRGAYILIPQALAVKLPPGHYFVDDIIGLRVVTVGGDELGVVEEVLRTGANDVYVTGRAMIPATREVVRRVDLGAGVMTVDLPEQI